MAILSSVTIAVVDCTQPSHRSLMPGAPPHGSIRAPAAPSITDNLPTPTVDEGELVNTVEDAPHRALLNNSAPPGTGTTVAISTTSFNAHIASVRKSFEDRLDDNSRPRATRSHSLTQLRARPSNINDRDTESVASASVKEKGLRRRWSTSSFRKDSGGSGLASALTALRMSLADSTSIPGAQTPRVGPEHFPQAVMGLANPAPPPAFKPHNSLALSSNFEGARSRSNTQLLALPSDGDSGISDTASIISASGGEESWHKPSSSSFRGVGAGGSTLGAAHAASGISLGHPTLVPIAQTPLVSPERLRQDTVKVTVPAPPPAFKFRRGSGDTDMDSVGTYDSDSNDGMSFNDHDIPITGFAVASSRRNTDFHEVFPDVPEGDHLIEDYGCALQREILIQGRMYISENHVCFQAIVFGWVANFTIPFTDVISLEKKMAAFVIPNAIQVATTERKYVFASFLSRDTTFDVIGNIWRLAHPGAITITSGQGGYLSASASDAGSIVNGGSILSDVSNGGAMGSPKVDPNSPTPLVLNEGPADARKKVVAAHKVTICECGKNKTHYPETAMEAVFPGTPEKLYNLMFASGFVKDFMARDQKFTSIQISDWHPASAGLQLLARNMSYTKPLNSSIGPKQTKCEITEETVHADFDRWVTTITTTRTPDLPSGGSFSVKTRTCIMWAGSTSTKIVVTTTVEWTGRSFLRSIIERSQLDGQQTYYADLEKAMRKYILDHTTEFLPEGTEAVEVIDLWTATNAASVTRTDAMSDSISAVPSDVGWYVSWISAAPLNTGGHFCDLFLGTHKTAGKVALKRMRTGATHMERETVNRHYHREAEIWKGFQHPRILQCIGTFVRDGHLYFVSPFMENGTLGEWLKRGIDVDRPRLIREIADALIYLHALRVIHGDLKANNVLLTDDLHILLCDFGLTKFSDSSTTTTLKGAGSVRWQSPELWENEPKSFQSDVYAFGMTITEVLTGRVPFYHYTNDYAVIKAVGFKDERPPKVPASSPTGVSWLPVWDVAERCWPADPKERISVVDAFASLSSYEDL